MTESKFKRNLITLIVSTLLIIGFVENAYSYIGPGAGFAFISSFFIIFITFILAFLTILFWPLRLAYKALRKKKRNSERHGVKRVIIVGLDGLDPRIAERYMGEGKLPNLSKLAQSGTFRDLETTLPSMSPVAWSTFITGVDPSRHNIFDFLNRDLKTYLPEISSTKIEKASRILSIGKYSIPISKPKIKLLRKVKPFWNILGEYGLFSSIIRVPITFPPEKLDGTLLSAMCVPDLRGSQGTFTFYTSDEKSMDNRMGGVQIPVKAVENKIYTYIPGPENSIVKKSEELKVPLEITLNGNKEVKIRINKEKYTFEKGEYSPWIKLVFKPGLNQKVRGVCRFLIKQTEPHFEMYMSPINIDPEKPALPISYPVSYSIYLSKMMGSYATLGLAEDTWALNERVIDEDDFLKQAYDIHSEREEMFFNALDKTNKGLCVTVFDATDRIQHMFMRFMSKSHPAHCYGIDYDKYKGVIEDLYMRMDTLVGKVISKLDEKDVLMVISDHGFKLFNRGVNLNTWLFENGYLALKDGKRIGDEYFKDVDWDKTKAYTFGLSGIYINEKGRESQGIVGHDEKEKLKLELIDKLKGLKDEEKGEIAIKEVFNCTEVYDGPYRENGPDLYIGYRDGYRISWGAAVGRVSEAVFEDNKKSWSGDHCIDPRLVPGVFYSNRKTTDDTHHIADIGPTVLDLFGIDVPSYMTGKSLVPSVANKEKE